MQQTGFTINSLENREWIEFESVVIINEFDFGIVQPNDNITVQFNIWSSQHKKVKCTRMNEWDRVKQECTETEFEKWNIVVSNMTYAIRSQWNCTIRYGDKVSLPFTSINFGIASVSLFFAHFIIPHYSPINYGTFSSHPQTEFRIVYFQLWWCSHYIYNIYIEREKAILGNMRIGFQVFRAQHLLELHTRELIF